MPTVKDITAHDSSDNNTYTIRYRPESGETLYISVSSIDHDKNLAKGSAPLKEPTMADESHCGSIKIHNFGGNSIVKLGVKVEKDQPEVLAKTDEEPVMSRRANPAAKYVRNLRLLALEECMATPSITIRDGDAFLDPQR